MSGSAVRLCEDHGYFEGEVCPICGRSAHTLVEGRRRTRLSKFMSGALRHFPEEAGLSLDDQGWAAYDELVSAATERYDWAGPEHVEAVIVTDPKGRFERSDGQVRAAYGHSIDVDLDAPDTPVPDALYHGTAPESLDAIREEGLKPMNRQHVHLSETVEEARKVGRRHTADPVILVVDTGTMAADDRRIVRRGRGIYTTDRVPPECLTRLDEAEPEP